MGLLIAFWDWLRGRANKEQLEELKEALPEKPILKAPLPPPIRKGTLEDIRDYCEVEMKKAIADMSVASCIPSSYPTM